MEARGLAAMRPQAPGEAPESGGFMDYLVPLTVSAITTAALAALMTPAAGPGAPAAAAALAPELMGSAVAGQAAAGVGGATAGELSQDAMAMRLAGGVAPGMGQPAPRPQVRQTSGMGGALQELTSGAPQQQMPQQLLPERDPEELRASRVGALMRGFGG